MLKHNLASSFRSILRNPSFSLINISGLSAGLTLVIILSAWLQFEFSFDRFHENADRIFRVVVEFKGEKIHDNFANTPAPLGEVLKREIPEITDYVRFGYAGRTLIKYENEQGWEDISLADPSVFNIFSFNLLKGNPGTCLDNPGSVIISESKARRYFGGRDPLGLTLIVGENSRPFVITGVMKDIPSNSQLTFDFLCPFSLVRKQNEWGIWNYSTYFLARKNSYRSISGKLPGIVQKIPHKDNFSLHIQPLLKIHLHSRLRSDLPTNTNIRTVYIIGSILVLVLLIACLNYMNLSTARFSKRGREAGLRKVAGATNSELMALFLCESFSIALSAYLISLLLYYLLLPILVMVAGVPLKFGSVFTFGFGLASLLLIFLISFLSGSYPALMLSRVSPISGIHEDLTMVGFLPLRVFRKGLVVFQFFISIALIAGALTIKSQLAFVRNMDLGLNPGQVVVVPVYQALVKPRYELYKKEIATNSAILSSSAVAYFPGSQGYHQNTWWEGLAEDDLSNSMDWISVDQDFLSTLKIELLKGDFLPADITENSPKLYLLNESAVKRIGWKDPVGKQFDIIGRGKVIGVVRDFNFKSLHNELGPAALTYYPLIFDNLLIRISPEKIPATMNFLKRKWDTLFPQYPFEYSFLSDDFQKMYKKETTISFIMTYISLLALIVSCIGLFGLVFFTIDSRSREIGIRKVSGSTTGKIVLMLNLEYCKWVLASFIIACPVIGLIMMFWLRSFAYRIGLKWWIFGLAGLITFMISLLTVSWHTWKTSSRNPVECLRHE